MTVDAVYNLWPYAMNSDIKVSSPVSALWPQASTGWFQPFMTKINANSNLDVDFIAIHCYPDNYAGAGMASWFLEQVVDWTWETYHKPIWITEFSTTGSNVTATGGNGTKEFWEAVMPGLDSREYVERYAAFDFNSSTTGLWLYNGTFTQAGEVYKKQGNPTVDYKGNTVVPGTALEGAKYVSASDANSQKPGKVKINKVKNLKGKKIKLTFKKIKNVAGYQIRICDNKKFNGYWNKNTKKRSVTFKKLDKNTRYYFKVRAYVKNSGKKLYGSWSNVKSVKVTK
jgi:hypothetical protein